MSSSAKPFEPHLAAPGAGLPAPELFIARMLFDFRHRFTSRAAADDKIIEEGTRIDELVARCGPQKASQRVLIKRIRGMEDSSRYWSVFMTLDHLRIVNTAVSSTISELLAGRVPAGTASTAAVKPSTGVDEHVVSAFRASCRNLLEAGKNARTLKTKVRFAHPWFGALDAAGWKFLGGFHLALHRGQIEVILKEQAA